MDEPQQDTTVPQNEIPESAGTEQGDGDVIGPGSVEDASGIAVTAAIAPTAATAADQASEDEPDETTDDADTDETDDDSDDDESDDLDSFEVEIEQTLSRTKLISRLKAIVLELEGGSLEVGDVPVAELGDEVDFEIGYSEKDGRHELEIELEW